MTEYREKRRAAFILGNDDPVLLASAIGIESRRWTTATVLPDYQPAKAGKSWVAPRESESHRLPRRLETPETPSIEIKAAVWDVASVVSDDILDGYVSDESDLATGLKLIRVGEELDSSESDHDKTLLEVKQNVADNPADKPPPL
ncbi:GL25474 [Drosophila persimilis]|uniref:GL25474 n=1 Tax=Drosophila persimilis TaxID=7234 RepID=B4HBG8_DROPE|nr:GL25474 [Drosophila persimilis]